MKLQKKIRFLNAKGEDFLTVARRQVDDYFEHSGISRNATLGHRVKVVVLFVLWFTTYYTILHEAFSEPVLLGLAVSLGIVTGLIGINLSHDAVHGSYVSHAKINKILGYTYDLIGMSSYVWKATHNGGHHIFTNVAGHDPDIDKPFLLRLSKASPRLWFHAFQNWYIWVLYSFVSLNWIYYSDYVCLFREIKRVPSFELFLFFFFKVINLCIFLIIPLIYMSLPWWQIFIGYLSLQMIGGLFVALIFQMAHLVEGVSFPLPDDNGLIHSQWGVHEMLTTANFGTKNPWLALVLGGLNFQVEHHLFPHIAHSHYPAIAPLVKETAAEFNLPYHESPSFLAAVASHSRLLKKLGRE